MKKFLTLLVLIIGISGASFAQPDNAKVETISGKKYYVHIVEQGNTLYGIHQLYQTSIETLFAENEGLTDELIIGQKILIPIQVSNEKFYTKHIVKQGETLYGISKKYECSVDDLINLNGNLSDGISPGQELIVPKKENAGQAHEVIQTDPIITENKSNISFSDTLVEHKVLAHETLYAIAKRYMVSSDTIMALNHLSSTNLKEGDVLKIPVKKLNYTILNKDLTKLNPKDTAVQVVKESHLKDMYNVALLLPLMLNKNDQEMSKPLRLDEVREMYGTTKISFDFYQGFLLAADSLTNAGVSINLYVYDTQRDTATIGKFFSQPEFADMDLVVGPISSNTINYTAKLCAQRHIRMVLPFNADADVIYQNPYVYKGIASNMTLMDGTVDYIIENHKHHNIILIKPTGAENLALYERVKERFNQKIKGLPGAYNLSIVEASLGSSGGRELNSVIKQDTANIIIIPSNDLTFVSGALARLNKVANMNSYAKNLRIMAFGFEEWNKFDDIDIKYRNRANQHYASYRFFDYDTEKGVKFVRAFRNEYGTDPSVYACQGFDYGMYFLSALYLYGSNFDSAIANHAMDLTQNDFQFRVVQPGSGRENQRVCIVKYDNYKLVQVK